MPNIDNYASGVQEKRKKRRFYFFFGVIIILLYAVVFGSIWAVLYSPLLRVANFTVVGNERMSERDITDFLRGRALHGEWRWMKAFLGFRNILTWPEALTDDDLRFLPEIKNLTLEKNYSERSIVARVEERRPYGIWCLQKPQMNADDAQINADDEKTAQISANKVQNQRQSAFDPRSSASDCWWFDDEGIVFRRAIAAEGSLILVVHDYSRSKLGLNIKILADAFIPNAFSIFKTIETSGLGIKEIVLRDLSLEELEVATYFFTPLGASNGPKLYFSLRFPATNAIAAIENFLQKPGFEKLQYLDFRVENRVYYK